MKADFLRAACISPQVHLADCMANANCIIEEVRQASMRGSQLVVFPELCITGASAAALFSQRLLKDGSMEALAHIVRKTAGFSPLFFAGLPIEKEGRLYNCTVAVQKGRLLALIPQTQVPPDKSRWFSPAGGEAESLSLPFDLGEVPFSSRLIFADPTYPAARIALITGGGFSACADAVQADAFITVHPLSEAEIPGMDARRRLIAQAYSLQHGIACLLACPGLGESTTDAVYAAHSLIAENGLILAESPPLGSGRSEAEIDLGLLLQERASRPPEKKEAFFTIAVDLALTQSPSIREIEPLPFVPSDPQMRRSHCRKTLALQAAGLAQRLIHTRAKRLVIGLSGGLDSSLALLACCKALKSLSHPASDILALTLPCFGTGRRTLTNAHSLAQAVGAEIREINIGQAVNAHFADIGHNPDIHNQVYENAQARERTQVLMDMANKENGLVVGTGDLSELALGWATYNGDHMSMYGLNASLPKSLIRAITETAAEDAEAEGNADLAQVLRDILATPVSPELIPSESDDPAQKTEDILGPYELHDFFLYYTLRFGFTPEKIYRLAIKAFKARYTDADIGKRLSLFMQRFFSQQFKRSCMPDGAQAGIISLSPRTAWYMPSDAAGALWLSQTATLGGQ